MKLVGQVKHIDRTVSKITPDGIEERRKFNILISTSKTIHGSSAYSYGNMNFTLNGTALSDLDLELGSDLDILVVPKGETYEGKDYEAARSELYDTQLELENLKASFERTLAQYHSANSKNRELDLKTQALQLENIRITTELITLKTMFAGGKTTMAQISPNANISNSNREIL